MVQTQHNQSTDGHPIVAAVYDRFTRHAEKNILPEHRRYLARDLHGVVLDLGAGTGAMFPYLKEAAQRDASLQLFGIEPDLYMRTRAERKTEDIGLDITIQQARAESLPFDDEHFDVVIASLVFCTIPDMEKALQEVHRVLKPGGEFRFLEHVRSTGALGQFQDVAAPVWQRLAAGCHLDRQTAETFTDSSLEVDELDTMNVGMFPVKPFIRGTAVRRE